MTFTAMGHGTTYTEGEVKEVGWLGASCCSLSRLLSLWDV